MSWITREKNGEKNIYDGDKEKRKGKKKIAVRTRSEWELSFIVPSTTRLIRHGDDI